MVLREKIQFLYHRNDRKGAFSEFPFFNPVTPIYREQELQVVVEQVLHALALAEAGDPSELLQNRESTL